MKNTISVFKTAIIIFTVLMSTLTIAQQLDSTSWYRYGQQEYWYYQKDVWTFRMQNGLPYTEQTDPVVVDQVVYHSDRPRKFNEFHFKAGTTPTQRLIEKNKARNNPVFECEGEVITKDPNLDKTQQKWYAIEDLIIVIFKDPDISLSDVAQFRNKYDVLPYREPYNDLPSGFFGFYAFRKNTGLCAQKTTSTIAKEMWANDAAILLAAEPYINLRIQSHSSCPTNDPYFDYNTQRFMWHINNNGTLYNSTGTQTSTSGSDAKICDCWDAGYNGWGIRIGALDFDGFEWTHEDLNGQFVNGWDCIADKAYTSTTALPTYVSGQYHGTSMSGTIAAGNNWEGIVGVAPGVKIVPILVSRTDVLTFGKALEQAAILNLDVANMSFGFTPDYSPWHILAQQLVDSGRPNPWDNAQKNGTILVASAGNNDNNTQQWPAAWSEVIGTIGTNPNDFRHSGSDGWGTGPSNYGFWYDIAAPGAFITTTSYMGKGSASLGNDYVNTGGTSFSSAITSGVAALLLSKNYTQRWDTLRSILYANTDKVQPSTYNNYNDDPVNYPGKSVEMGYGRINCIKALNATPVGIKEVSKNNFDIQVFNSSPEELTILYNLKEKKNVSAKIFDVFGREAYSQMLQPKNFREIIQLNGFADGLYVIAFYSNQDGILKSYKFVKY